MSQIKTLEITFGSPAVHAVMSSACQFIKHNRQHLYGLIFERLGSSFPCSNADCHSIISIIVKRGALFASSNFVLSHVFISTGRLVLVPMCRTCNYNRHQHTKVHTLRDTMCLYALDERLVGEKPK